MSKPELTDLLREMGEEPHPKWTSAEIEDRIKTLRTEAAGVHPVLQGLSDRLKKEELRDRANRLGIVISGHETKRGLLIVIRDEVERTTVPKASDVVGFG